jgi:pimeloyl-ACP methyl ester carboxylesterase
VTQTTTGHPAQDSAASLAFTQEAPGVIRPPSRSLRRWSVRGLGGVVVLFGLLAVAGATYQAIATETERRAFPPPGQLVDVGGYRLHLHCSGQGTPTAILQSGLANRSADWELVQPEVARTTRVCSYDRAGIGWSDSGPEPRDSLRIARELHILLANAGVPGPYVMVGQSFGGLYARMYSGLHPDEVVGMVLVDASHPDMWAYAPAEYRALAQPDAAMGFTLRAAERLGIVRLINMFPVPADCGLPPPSCAAEQAYRNARRADAYVAEMGAPERDAQVRATPDLGDRPLVVLTASDHSDLGLPPASVPQFERDWRQLQDDLAGLSTNSQHLLVDGAFHATLQTTHAAVTSDAIQRVVEAARTGQLLAP